MAVWLIAWRVYLELECQRLMLRACRGASVLFRVTGPGSNLLFVECFCGSYWGQFSSQTEDDLFLPKPLFSSGPGVTPSLLSLSPFLTTAHSATSEFGVKWLTMPWIAKAKAAAQQISVMEPILFHL